MSKPWTLININNDLIQGTRNPDCSLITYKYKSDVTFGYSTWHLRFELYPQKSKRRCHFPHVPKTFSSVICGTIKPIGSKAQTDEVETVSVLARLTPQVEKTKVGQNKSKSLYCIYLYRWVHSLASSLRSGSAVCVPPSGLLRFMGTLKEGGVILYPKENPLLQPKRWKIKVLKVLLFYQNIFHLEGMISDDYRYFKE